MSRIFSEAITTRVFSSWTREQEPSATEPARHKFHLIHIDPYKNFPGSFTEPTGITQLAGTIQQANKPWDVYLGRVVSDETLSALIEHLSQVGTEHAPEFIGLSLPLGSGENVFEILEIIANRNLTSKVILGGNLPTGWPQEYLEEIVIRYPFIYIIRGWGDGPLLRLLDYFESGSDDLLEKIPGLVYMRDGVVFVNMLEDSINYDEVGTPIRLKTESESIGFIHDSSDCSHPFCTFCPRPQYGKREQWKPRPAESIIRQAIEIAEGGSRSATFSGEEALGTSLVQAVRRIEELCDAFYIAKTRGYVPIDFGIALSTRSDTIVALVEAGYENLLATFCRLVLKKVFLGVETGVPLEFERFDGYPIPSQSKRYGKGISPDKHVIAIETLRQLGVSLEIGIIMFDPLVDLSELEVHAQYLIKHDVYRSTSAVLNIMRIQQGAKYEKATGTILAQLVSKGILTTAPELFGELNMSTLQRQSEYLHPIVGDVVAMTTGIAREQWEIAYGLKQWGRSQFITGEPEGNVSAQILADMRHQELLLLQSMVLIAKKEALLDGGRLHSQHPFSQLPDVTQAVNTFRAQRKTIFSEAMRWNLPQSIREKIEAMS